MASNPNSLLSSPAKTMNIEITNKTILKASPSIPHPLTNTLAPLTVFDRAALDFHVAVITAYRPPLPSLQAIKDGLAKVLEHFPHFCGRMYVDERNRHYIHLNNAGIRLIEARVSGTLDQHLPLETQENIHQLHGPLDGIEELLQIQLNFFSCGGLVVGMTNHHWVCDGPSIMNFYVAWTETVRNATFVPKTFLDRASAIVARDPPSPAFNHREIEFRARPKRINSTEPSKVENLVVHFSPEFLEKIKKMIPQRCSRFECVLAHLWKKITIARGLEDEETSEIRVAVNGRGRTKPAIPVEYFGNLVLWAFPKLKVKDLKNLSHSGIVKVIHDAVSKVNEHYFRSFIDFGKILDDNNESLKATAADSGESLCPNLEVDSWLRFDLEDLNFGSGGPCAISPPNIPVEGLMVFSPSCAKKGGIDVFMALDDQHVQMFTQICHGLDDIYN